MTETHHVTFRTEEKTIQMRLNGMMKKQVAEELGIQDLDRLKVSMRKYKTEGAFGLVDQRGEREKYLDRKTHE